MCNIYSVELPTYSVARTGGLRSHLMPMSVYKVISRCGRPAWAPVTFNASRRWRSSMQVKDTLLCADCEQRLSSGGEGLILNQQYVSSQHIPRRDRLRKRHRAPICDSAGYIASAVSDVEVSPHKLVYFGVSVIWRVAVHSWRINGLRRSLVRFREIRGGL